MQVFGPLLFATIAAIGNGFFAYGQRKATGVENTFVFITITLIVCVTLCMATAPLLGKVSYAETLRNNAQWTALSGFGLYLTYIGFNILYARYGAANYILYAVISIITTSVVVGAWMLREQMNLYHWLAVCTALLTVGLFSWGNKLG